MHTHELFRFMARGQSPITIVSFCSFRLNFICCLHLLGYDKFRLSSASRQVTWVCFHWNYIFISNLSYWRVRQLASKIVAILSEQNISQASYFENSCGECMITLSLPRSGACNLAILNCARDRPVAVALCLRSRNAILPSVLLVQFAHPGKHLISYAVVFVSEFHCSLVQLHDWAVSLVN